MTFKHMVNLHIIPFVYFLNAVVNADISSPVISTKSGPIQGRLLTISPGLEVYEFLGIPFAEPPLGEFRFRKPITKTPWTDVLKATSWPSSCIQAESGEPLPLKVPQFYMTPIMSKFIPLTTPSEDCLFLNLWVPRRAIDYPSAPLAAYTFIHGGGFTAGNTATDLFNGTILAAYSNLIVATIQYRLGFLGFAYNGTEEMPGNMGMWDQVEALKWLCENLPVFGGNCSRHTIAGESAGAASVALHILSPHSKPYFSGAILESGNALADWAAKDRTALQQATALEVDNFADRSCENATEILECLLQLNETSFGILLNSQLGLVPMVDGDFLPAEPIEILKSGNFSKVPVIIGVNKDEGSFFILDESYTALNSFPMYDGKFVTPEVERRLLATLNSSHFSQLMGEISAMAMGNGELKRKLLEVVYWPKGDSGLPKGALIADAAVQASGDFQLTCPTLRWPEVTSAFDSTGLGNRTFVYHFTQRRANDRIPQWVGVTHTEELPYFFGTPFSDAGKVMGFTYDDKQLSRAIMAYISNFAKSGNPNFANPNDNSFNQAVGGLRLRHWPSFTSSSACPMQSLDLSALSQVYNFGSGYNCGLKARECSFWNNVMPAMANISDTYF